MRNVRRFFSEISREGSQLAWEPRGDWSYELVAALCEELDLLHCVDPFATDLSEVAAPYWRLHGKSGYSYRYSNEDLEELSSAWERCAARTKSPRNIFFNNIWMKEDAIRSSSGY